MYEARTSRPGAAALRSVCQHLAKTRGGGKGQRQRPEPNEEQNSQAGFRFTISRCIHDLKPYRKF
jgi:hypothetical protein